MFCLFNSADYSVHALSTKLCPISVVGSLASDDGRINNIRSKSRVYGRRSPGRFVCRVFLLFSCSFLILAPKALSFYLLYAVSTRPLNEKYGVCLCPSHIYITCSSIFVFPNSSLRPLDHGQKQSPAFLNLMFLGINTISLFARLTIL